MTETMPDLEVCQSYIAGRDLCRDGHPQSAPCWGDAGVPFCLHEEACGRRYEANGGKPPEKMPQ